MDKVNAESLDILKENVRQFKMIFPECVNDDRIDFKKFKEIINNYTDDQEEKYSFTWDGKKEAFKNSQTSSVNTLLPVKDKSLNWNNTENIYIEGDNLEVLKILQKSYMRKIKLIYIDPPYNTGKDFIYSDNYSDALKNYKEQTGQINKANPETSGRFHTKWLNMMYPRLRLAKNLLTDDGIIFISIDDNEVTNLMKICDEVFGEHNFLADFIWNSRKSVSNDAIVSLNHNYTLCYVKNMDKFIEKKANFKLPDDGSGFDNPDNDPRGPWKADPFDSPGVRQNLTYIIKNPNNGDEYFPPNGRCWRTGEKEYLEYLADNRIVFGKNGTSRPQLKRFLSEAQAKGLTPKSLWDDCGTATDGTNEIIKYFGKRVFDTPKPTSFIQKIINLATNDNDIVLDFFSGSATTAEAVMKKNVSDNKTLKYIMVQLPEDLDENLKTASNDTEEMLKNAISVCDEINMGHNLCVIGEERIRRAGRKIKKENGALAQNLDIGFKVFKLDSSNIKLWNGENIDINNANEYFYEHMDPIVEGRTEEDLLYEILLKEGMMLSSPIEEKIINDKKIYSVGMGYMIVCLDDNIDVELVREIGKLNPETVIFKDSGFVDENAKANALQELKKMGIEEEKVKSI